MRPDIFTKEEWTECLDEYEKKIKLEFTTMLMKRRIGKRLSFKMKDNGQFAQEMRIIEEQINQLNDLLDIIKDEKKNNK